MVHSQYSLSWDSHKTSVCNGLSSLQQNGEFVDMTLAADGHFVKVHQVLVALASPYLKDIMTSAPCQHPVIFLNNVSYKNLTLLLEYIYTGEVLIPAESLTSFAQAAKSLHIRGLEDMVNDNSQTYKMTTNVSAVEDSALCHISGIKNLPISSSCGSDEINLPAAARKIYIKHETDAQKIRLDTSNVVTIKDTHDYPDTSEERMDAQDDDDFHFDSNTHTTADLNSGINKDKPNLLFTVSIRGSLQIILNRYLYNLNATTTRAGVRKWRCVEYRNKKCNAFVVTKGNIVISRANPHNHPFHDKKILAKIEKKSVFSALDDAENYKKAEDTEMESHITTEDNMISFDDLSDGLKLRSEQKK